LSIRESACTGRLLFCWESGRTRSSATDVSAGSPSKKFLRGEYSLNGSRECVYTNANDDFGPAPYFQLVTGGSKRTSHFKGVLQLHGDGTGSLNVEHLQINNQQVGVGGYPLTAFEGLCEVNYQSVAHGTFKMRISHCDGPITAGSSSGGTAGTVEEALSVAVSAEGDVLLLSGTDPQVETIWATSGGTTSYWKRICSRSAIAIRRPR
jgi:hypothetical protein